jgi:hypothetical protein
VTGTHAADPPVTDRASRVPSRAPTSRALCAGTRGASESAAAVGVDRVHEAPPGRGANLVRRNATGGTRSVTFAFDPSGARLGVGIEAGATSGPCPVAPGAVTTR